MLDRYKVFSEQHNKLLDLVEMVDQDLANKYQKFISSMPDDVYDLLDTKKKFAYKGDNCKVVLDRFDNMLEFEHVREDKYLCTSLNLYTFYEDDLLDEVEYSIDIDPDIAEDQDDMLFLFSMTITNTTEEPEFKLTFEEVDGKYVYTGEKLNAQKLEIDYEVFIEKRDDEFYLICNKTLNGLHVYSKELPISYEALLEYAMDEEIEDYPDEDEDNIDYTELSFENPFDTPSQSFDDI